MTEKEKCNASTGSANEANTQVDLNITPKNENGTISLSVTSRGSKLTKADSGRMDSFTEEIFVTAKISFTEKDRLPIIEASVSEKCGSKLTKADSGLV
ncbi:MAG: hypothetical protein IT246_07850 [Bacteroidia bacterium]|nr:hypothetical protein [Bacteroidia bacterium]